MAGRVKRTTKRRASSAGGAEAVLSAIRKGEPPAVLLVTGRDTFTRDAVLEELRRCVLTEGFESFDEIVLSAESHSGEQVVSQAEALPMGGRYRLIRVRRAQKFKEKDAGVIAAYAESPAPTARLVLICDESKGPLVSKLKKVAAHLDCPPPRDYQLSRWIEAQAQRLGITLHTDAARALGEIMGENFIGAMSVLNRAAVHRDNDHSAITREEIEALAGQGRDTNPFHLGDAILSREPVRAIRILRSLYETGGTGYMILAMLEGQLRRFLGMRSRVDAGEPARSVVESTSPTLPPGVKARLTEQLETFDMPRLTRAFRIARETDRAIKSHGSGSEASYMEALVWRICAL